jgi:hypothetical protein
MGILSLGSSGSRTKKTPRPTPLGSPGGSGAIPIGYARTHPLRRNPIEPNSATTSTWGSGAFPSPQAPDLCQHSGLALGSCPANDASQGPGTRRQAPSYRGSGAPWRCPLGMALLATFLIRSRTGCDIRRQSFPVLLEARGLLGPCVSQRRGARARM